MVKRDQRAGTDAHVGAEQFAVDLFILAPAYRLARFDPGHDAVDDSAVRIEIKPIEDFAVGADFRQKAKTDEIGVEKCLHLVLYHGQNVVQLIGIQQLQRKPVKSLVQLLVFARDADQLVDLGLECLIFVAQHLELALHQRGGAAGTVRNRQRRENVGILHQDFGIFLQVLDEPGFVIRPGLLLLS